MSTKPRESDEDADEKERAEMVVGERQLPIVAFNNPQGIIAQPERSALAAAVQAQAIVRARFEMAFMRPRDVAMVRAEIVEDLKRPAFTERARYDLRKHNRGEGWSIRFAERLMQLMGNMHPLMHIIHDDDKKIVLYIEVIDLERNASAPVEVSIPKTVERQQPRPGTTILAQRPNSEGKMISIVPATAEEVDTKRAQYASKALRTCIMRLTPPAILEAAKAQFDETKAAMDKRVAEDPTAEINRLLDGFAKVRVKPDQLARYLGHPVDQSSPAEIVELRSVYAAVRDGEARWLDLVVEAERERAEAAEEGRRPAGPREAVRSLEDLKARQKAKGEPAGTPPPSPPSDEHARNCGIYVPTVGVCTCKDDE